MKSNLPTKPIARWWLIGAIVAVAAVLRLYNLSGTLLFQGDQGRDAMIVARIFKQADLVFIGPVMSVGNMYLGPLYYYFMLPWLWLSYPSPLGPVYGIALLGIATVGLLYWLGRELLGEKPALLASALYAVSTITVQYSRFSWNPNPEPFVSLVMMWATYRAWQKNAWYWVVVGTCVAVLMQLHYLSLLSAAGAGMIWLYQVYQTIRTKNWQLLTRIGLASVAAAAIVILSLTPVILFDAKHNWLNVKAFQSLFTKEQSFKITNNAPWPARIADTVKEMHGRSLHIFWEIPLGRERTRNTILLISELAIWGLFARRLWQSRTNGTQNPLAGWWVVSCFALTGVMGTAVYDHTIFDHYIAYLFPVTFLVMSATLVWLWQSTLGKVVFAGVVALYLSYNVPRLPHQTAGWTITDMNRVSQKIVSLVPIDAKYNVVLLSESKDLYGQNYRYFLSTTNHPPVAPENSAEADLLVIINEQKLVTDPVQILRLPIWEITTFPAAGQPTVYLGDHEPDLILVRR